MNTQKIAITIFVIFLTSQIARADCFTFSTKSPKALSRFDLAIEEIKIGHNLDAFNYFKEATDFDPEFALAYVGMALIHPTHTQEAAAAFFQEAIKHRSKVSVEEQALIDAFNMSERPKMLEQLQTLSDDFPDETIVLYALSQMQFTAREYEKALGSFKKLLQVDPRWSVVYNGMGYCYLFLDNPAKAEKCFKTQIEKLPDDPNAYDSMGEFYLGQKKHAESIKMYQIAIIKESKFLSSHKGLGINYAYIEEFDRSLEHFGIYYDLAKSSQQKFDALLSTTTTYLAKNDVPTALKTLKDYCDLAQTVNGHDELCQAVHLMGDFNYEIGNFDEAEKIFKRDIELRLSRALPNDWRVWHQATNFLNLGMVALKRGDLIKAEKYATKQLEIDMENPEEFTSHRRLLYEIAMFEKRFDDALKILQKENQDYPHAWRRLARVYEAKGKKKLARTYWQKIIEFPYFDNYYAAFFRHEAKDHLASL